MRPTHALAVSILAIATLLSAACTDDSSAAQTNGSSGAAAVSESDSTSPEAKLTSSPKPSKSGVRAEPETEDVPKAKWKRSGPFKFKFLDYDFGDMRDTEKRSVVYEFFNAEDHPVRILEVKKSCGCTYPELELRVYQPGEDGKLKVTFDGNHRQGQDLKHVTILTDNPEDPIAKVSFKAYVIARIAIEPRSVFLGMLSRGEASKEKDFRIVSRNLDLKIESFESSDPERFPLTQGKVEHTVDHGDDVVVYNFTTSFKGDFAIDQHKTILKIKTNDKEKKYINVVALAQVVGPINVVPFKLQLRGVLPNKEFTHKIQLGPRAKETRFKIKEARLIGAQKELHLNLKQLPIDPKRNGWVALELTGKTPAQVDKKTGFQVKGSIYIRTDLAEQPEIIIPLSGVFRY